MDEPSIPQTPSPPTPQRGSWASWNRASYAASWVVPAAVFAVSGAAKLIDPAGTAPHSVAALTDRVSWPVVLRLVGAVELSVTAFLILPQARLAGRYAAFLLLAVLSAFVAWNAADSSFVENCGCTGAWNIPGASFHDVTAILLRNAVVLFLVAFGAYLDARQPVAPRTAASHAGVAVGLVLLGMLYGSERASAAHAAKVVDAMVGGQMRASMARWPLPDFGVVTEDGKPTTALRVLRGRDHLLFFSTHCPHCRRLAPLWGGLGNRLTSEGARLVLMAVDEKGGSISDFKRTNGCAFLPHLVLRQPLDLRRLGIEGVPRMAVLDANRYVVGIEGAGVTPSFAAQLALVGSRVEGMERHAWGGIAVAAFGPGTELTDPLVVKGEVRSAGVKGPDGRRGTLFVASSPRDPSYGVELAVALDDQGTVVGIVPLAAGDFVGVVGDAWKGLDDLRGLKIGAAATKAIEKAKGASLAAPAWMGVGKVLRALEVAVGAR